MKAFTTLPSSARGPVAIGAVALGVLLVSGCAADASPESTPVPLAKVDLLQHIHGLGVNSESGVTYVATHVGIFRLPGIDTALADASSLGAPLGEHEQDTMGFTIDGTVLYASGHPQPEDVSETGGSSLGLITSVDDARTWNTVSLGGRADFHDLDVVNTGDGETTVYGYEASAARVSSSRDGGKTWTGRAELAMRDLAADPAIPGTVFATTGEGLMVSSDYGDTFALVPNAPSLYLVESTGDALGSGLIGVDLEGKVWVSTGNDTWQVTGSVSGQVQALTYSDGPTPILLVADDRGVVSSTDLGSTWSMVVNLG